MPIINKANRNPFQIGFNPETNNRINKRKIEELVRLNKDTSNKDIFEQLLIKLAQTTIDNATKACSSQAQNQTHEDCAGAMHQVQSAVHIEGACSILPKVSTSKQTKTRPKTKAPETPEDTEASADSGDEAYLVIEQHDETGHEPCIDDCKQINAIKFTTETRSRTQQGGGTNTIGVPRPSRSVGSGSCPPRH